MLNTDHEREIRDLTFRKCIFPVAEIASATSYELLVPDECGLIGEQESREESFTDGKNLLICGHALHVDPTRFLVRFR